MCIRDSSGEDAEDWLIIESVNELMPGENRFNFAPPESLLSTMYIDYEDGEVYIYLGSYS